MRASSPSGCPGLFSQVSFPSRMRICSNKRILSCDCCVLTHQGGTACQTPGHVEYAWCSPQPPAPRTTVHNTTGEKIKRRGTGAIKRCSELKPFDVLSVEPDRAPRFLSRIWSTVSASRSCGPYPPDEVLLSGPNSVVRRESVHTRRAHQDTRKL